MLYEYVTENGSNLMAAYGFVCLILVAVSSLFMASITSPKSKFYLGGQSKYLPLIPTVAMSVLSIALIVVFREIVFTACIFFGCFIGFVSTASDLFFE